MQLWLSLGFAGDPFEFVIVQGLLLFSCCKDSPSLLQIVTDKLKPGLSPYWFVHAFELSVQGFWGGRPHSQGAQRPEVVAVRRGSWKLCQGSEPGRSNAEEKFLGLGFRLGAW